ncbi:hypothetical protein X471_00855 [Bartonella bacilliformis str. Heidi Mejia]|nr:LPS assembly lipoprotein LptE [Bartonella bacilliformis]AMG85335.1 hypothetical protein AL467_00680 [Bartonella bacilliformis]EKS46000.1 hypothetical protein BbINS_00510 [Bartonella bacilliformis INS]EYS88761.1 hypothetical protein X472_00848 [Bartonella bacilliformis San Pedro600-02]EYS90723.1 hypothetical protein X471_00855 [Bartonella bacilliformis str. Heidi Mejia]KEG18062.1 hypothetical protein H705_00102 [Bartonella bacilliformis Cond044]
MLFFSRLSCVVCTFMLALLCGCTIEPLYRQAPQSSTVMGSGFAGRAEEVPAGLAAKLAMIVVDEPSDRFSQMVRNHLLFLMHGGGGKPATPKYQLSLYTSVMTRTSLPVESDPRTGRTWRFSVGTVVGRASYSLKDMKDNVIAQGKGTLRASFDRPHQEYATLQAEKDAEKRVATELAEQIFMRLAKDLAKL